MVEHLYRYNSDDILFSRMLDPIPDQKNFCMHTHDFCELLFVLHGKGSYLVEGSRYPIQPGCILMMRDNESHQLLSDETQPYDRVVLQFYPKAISSDSRLFEMFYGRELGQWNYYEPDQVRRSCAGDLLLRMQSHTLPKELTNLIFECEIPACLLLLLEVFFEMKAGGFQKREKGTGELLIDFVNQHLFDDLSLSFLSDHFFLSKSQLNRIFRASTGTTLWEYVLAKRLVVARQKIRSGGAIQQICRECGFRDYSSFWRAYRKKFGTGPANDRKR